MSQENIHTGNGQQLTFLAFARDTADITTLKAFAAAHGWAEADVRQGDIQTAADFLKDHPSPSILLIEIPTVADASAQLDALANVCAPDTKVVAIGVVNEYSFYCWLMEMGISSYLLKPLTSAMLEGMYLKVTEQAGAAAKEAKKRGKVVAVIGTRGGVGATTVALNLAGVYADAITLPVALIDVDPHVGSAAMMLELEPSRGLREALEKPDRVDSLFIERVMVKPHKNLSVLSSEDALHDHLVPHALAAEMLLTELREKFAMIIVDIPRQLSNHTMDFLRRADQIILVTEMTLLSLRDALRLCDVFRDALENKPTHIVANRVGLAAKFETPLADFEKGIGTQVACKIPFSPDVFMQIGGDIPSVKMKTHAALKGLQDLADKLAPELKIKKPTTEKKSFNLLKKK